MMPPTPLTSMVAPIRSGATSCTLRPKKARLSGLPRAGAFTAFLVLGGIVIGGNRGRNWLRCCQYPGRSARAFSSEVETGSREENASKQESRAPFRFNRNGKGSSQGRQAPAASCRDCSAAWLPQEHTPASRCKDCTEAFRQGRQAPASSCRGCSAAWLPQEHTPVSWYRDCSAAAAPPLSLRNIEKAQARMLAGMDARSYGPLSRAIQNGGHPPALPAGMKGAGLHNQVNCKPPAHLFGL